jgi:DNA-binding CsgD family transcriptional regulator
MKATILLLFFSLLSGRLAAQPAAAALLKELDAVILSKDVYRENKEALLANIKILAGGAHSDELLYDIYEKLYNEYLQYNADSAFSYALHKLALAKKINNRRLVVKSELDVADLYAISGAYTAGLDRLKNVGRQALAAELLPRYYHVHRILYEMMAQQCPLPQLREAYAKSMELYRDSLISHLTEADIAQLFVATEKLTEKAACREALDLLLEKYHDEKISTHERAMLAYSIARAYRGLQHTDSAVYYYAVSAINDLKTPVKEYRALQTLALILYEEGEIYRAYKYINLAINDALEANAQMNVPFISTLIPVISQTYSKQLKEKEKLQAQLIWFISILLLALISATIIVYVQKRKVAAAERKAQAVNRQFASLNEELSLVNDKLRDINTKLLESNNIKETYVVRYMDLCSEYIGRVEKYRIQLGKMAREKGAGEVIKALKSTEYLDDELREFYANFDATFLHLFPNFVEQLNALLKEDKRIVLKPGKLLNTELRIFALIRLGVSDSVKIAEFLRHSVNTVYNYRVKMRNLAINHRDDFEKQVMMIG